MKHRRYWIKDLQTATEDFYICSECGRKIRIEYPDRINNYPYCICGSRNDGNEVEGNNYVGFGGIW